MTYTEGWPKRLSLPTGTITDGAADFTTHEVVPLSDAESLKAQRDAALVDRDSCNAEAQEYLSDAEQLREALERALDESHTYETLRGRVIAALSREGEG
jgi:hypothetical protein